MDICTFLNTLASTFTGQLFTNTEHDAQGDIFDVKLFETLLVQLKGWVDSVFPRESREVAISNCVNYNLKKYHNRYSILPDRV